MRKHEEQPKRRLTSAGTDIDEVKRLNQQSGLSYNQVKDLLAKNAAEADKKA
ncbi:hypothetical protein LCL89_09275 [Halobacillus yeomjeoni]|uniref:hypothetical protein n=1 Tax=Halobacillus yeomjeoni TaxID=311194 RepID=UPI001CD525D0|nr:hypothetical protein [Halobacillus yeomjeoni]MCA0984234.1 hypothetical protein [Halobacillus yeomjeoni]